MKKRTTGRSLAVRQFKDVIARYGSTFGGLSVIGAVLLIMFYLVYVVYPLFLPASMQQIAAFDLPAAEQPQSLYVALDEKGQVGLRITTAGEAIFFSATDGKILTREKIAHTEQAQITAFAMVNEGQGLFAVGFSDGTALLVKHSYRNTYTEYIEDGIDKVNSVVSAYIEYPLGQEAVELDPQQRSIALLAVTDQDTGVSFAATLAGADELTVVYYAREENFMTEETVLEFDSRASVPVVFTVASVLLDPTAQWLYLIGDDGHVTFYGLDGSELQLYEQSDLTPDGEKLTTVKLLNGGISILVGMDNGRIAQWFPVRQDNGYKLMFVREFEASNHAVTDIYVEQRRKGFVAVDQQGLLGVYYTTSERTLILEDLGTQHSLDQVALSSRSDLAMTISHGRVVVMKIDNEHPEVSFSSLWSKVWYESYPEPDYVWQSSAADNDFEPKFSLTPLAFGTLKAALYAMLFALPLALCGAIYTAYFMSASLRQYVKPVIEIMEALPTVIIGFLAGLWLAPWVEVNMPGLVLMFILTPISMLAFAFLWSRAPAFLRLRIPEGWDPILLMPVLLAVGVLSFSLDNSLEGWLFDGSMPLWLTNEAGIDFDQRNSLVIGLAMGFAIIPTIFSIAEDAVFGVPKHLTNGSLALGATRWQTLVKVVLLTASPGIFSAVMIGFGRAVGETMIVLMATGNTAVMDMSVFQGMRTLSANIAVEMPESEVGSSHYRVLFFGGLVLFAFTFLFNTIAELVRQRLREKYKTI